jgi:hypothetical protein
VTGLAKPLKYTDVVDDGWAAIALQTIQVAASPNADRPVVLDLAGDCPRCKDPTTDSHWLISFSGVSSMDRDDALRSIEALRDTGVLDEPLLPAEFSVQCRCTTKHPDPLGRTGLHGCGAIWRMRFEAVEDAAP